MAKHASIKITSDTTDAKKGIEKTTASLNKLTKEVKNAPITKLKDSWDSAAKTIQGAGLGAIIAAEVKVLKEELKAIKDTAEAFNIQLKAETKLAQAAENSVYLNGQAVEELKKYASQLQSIGDYGDEELIPMMASLAASGRTQSEIMQIMSVGLDAATGSGQSLNEIIKQLNKSYTGELGELSNLVPELKNLTKEQLKSGDAIEIIGEKYKGMSQAATEATGSAKQLQMASGDLQETIGTLTKPAYDAWNEFWLMQVNQLNGIISTFSNWLDDLNMNAWFGGGYRHMKEVVKDYKKEKDNFSKEGQENILSSWAQSETDTALENMFNYLNGIKKRDETEEEILKAVNAEKGRRAMDQLKKDLEAQYREEFSTYSMDELKAKQKEVEANSGENVEIWAQRKAVAQEIQKRQKEELDTQNKLLEDYNKTVKAKEEELKTRKSAGQEITREAELQDMLNTKLNAYVQFTKMGGDASSEQARHIREDIQSIGKELDGIEKKRKQQEENERKAEEDKRKAEEDEEALKQKLQEMNDEVIALKESAWDLLGIIPEETKLSDLMSDTIDRLKGEAEGIDKKTDAYKQYIEQIAILEELLPKVIEAEDNAGKKTKTWIESLSQIGSVIEPILGSFDSIVGSINSILDTYLTSRQAEFNEEGNDLEKQLDNDVITYEEYLEKKKALDRKAADEEYKIKMAEWSLNMTVATAKAAMAVLNALSSGTPPLNIINAVTASMLGAAQLVAIGSAMPKKPSFSTGGFLTGNSYHGDKIPFNGNAGEAILNPAEQRNFLNLANGNFDNNGPSLIQPINIVNNCGNEVGISASAQDKQIKITVDKIVNTGLQSGVYNNGLQSANVSMKGAKYL